jgi:membrane protein
MIAKIIKFLNHDIWRIRLKDHTGTRAFFLKHLLVFMASLKGFTGHQCQLRASALTYYSLLSIVPVIAMAFGGQGIRVRKTTGSPAFGKISRAA